MKSFYDYCIEIYNNPDTPKGYVGSKMRLDERFPKKERGYTEIINYFLKDGSNDETMRIVKNLHKSYDANILRKFNIKK